MLPKSEERHPTKLEPKFKRPSVLDGDRVLLNLSSVLIYYLICTRKFSQMNNLMALKKIKYPSTVA